MRGNSITLLSAILAACVTGAPLVSTRDAAAAIDTYSADNEFAWAKAKRDAAIDTYSADNEFAWAKRDATEVTA